MTYTPKTEEQLAKEGLLPDGTYDFEITETEKGISKKGNEMWIIKQTFFDLEGNGRIIKTWITFGNNYGERMFRHLADTCGLIAQYDGGNLKHSDFVGKSGRADIIQRQDDKLTWWNSVKDYVKRDPMHVEKPKKSGAEDLSDEIPF